MTLATLAEVLKPAQREGYAVAGLVCLGWEDSRAYALAAEAEGAPVILQAGPGCRDHTPLPVLAPMLRHLAESVSVPVVVHLDHGRSLEECRQAIGLGFTSIMFDGSASPLDRNIEETARAAEIARAAGVSCEGEIGVVGYPGGAASRGTDPEDARRFERETLVDAVAISVGNLHLQRDAAAPLDEARLWAIEAATRGPLVIHGGSGVPGEQRARLARSSRICKFNIGTELRLVFGRALRRALNADPERFDRLAILGDTHEAVMEATRAVLRSLGSAGRAAGAGPATRTWPGS
jgi:fructose-bisphosphate aldolase class II